jgi:hypothetical protein
LKLLEEGIKNDGQEDGPYDGREKRGEDLVEQIDGKEGEEKNEDEKDVFSFHFLPR